MKKILLLILFIAALGSHAQNFTAFQPLFPTLGSPATFMPGQTNSTEAINLTGAENLSVAVSFTGIATTTSTISVTNPAGTTNGCRIALVGAATTLYWFTNAPVYTNAIPTNAATLLTIGVTNTASTNGDTLAIVLGANTNTYIFTNASSAYSTIITNDSANKVATNIYDRLSTDYPSMTFTVGDNLVTIQVATNANLSVQLSSFATNGSTSVFTATNYVATNSLQILTNATPQGTATNLYTKFLEDYGATHNISYGSSTSVVVTSYSSTGLAFTNAGNWATVTSTTNAALGTVSLVASNSLDKVTWFRDAERDFSATLTSGGSLTNFLELGAVGYVKYGVASPTTNGGAANFKLGFTTK